MPDNECTWKEDDNCIRYTVCSSGWKCIKRSVIVIRLTAAAIRNYCACVGRAEHCSPSNQDGLFIAIVIISAFTYSLVTNFGFEDNLISSDPECQRETAQSPKLIKYYWSQKVSRV